MNSNRETESARAGRIESPWMERGEVETEERRVSIGAPDFVARELH